MKNTSSLKRVAFLALALSTAGLTAALAQDTPPADSGAAAPAAAKKGGAKAPKQKGALSDEEKAKVKTAHDAAVAADPSLQKEGDDIMAKGAAATQEEKDAHKKKMRAAMLKIDPTLQPLFDKQDAFMAAKAAAAGGTPAP